MRVLPWKFAGFERVMVAVLIKPRKKEAPDKIRVVMSSLASSKNKENDQSSIITES